MCNFKLLRDHGSFRFHHPTLVVRKRQVERPGETSVGENKILLSKLTYSTYLVHSVIGFDFLAFMVWINMLWKMFCDELDTKLKVFWKPNSNHSLSFTVVHFFSILEIYWCHQNNLVFFQRFSTCGWNIFLRKNGTLNLTLHLKNLFKVLFKF